MGNSEHLEPKRPGRKRGTKNGQGKGRPKHETRQGSNHPTLIEDEPEKVDRRKRGPQLFQKGQNGARMALPKPEARMLRETAREQLIRAYSKFTNLAPGQPLPEPEGLVEEAILRALRLWAETGNSEIMRVLWDRVIGKMDMALVLPVGADGMPAAGLQIMLDRLPEPGSVGAVIEAEATIIDADHTTEQ